MEDGTKTKATPKKTTLVRTAGPCRVLIDRVERRVAREGTIDVDAEIAKGLLLCGGWKKKSRKTTKTDA